MDLQRIAAWLSTKELLARIADMDRAPCAFIRWRALGKIPASTVGNMLLAPKGKTTPLFHLCRLPDFFHPYAVYHHQ